MDKCGSWAPRGEDSQVREATSRGGGEGGRGRGEGERAYVDTLVSDGVYITTCQHSIVQST